MRTAIHLLFLVFIAGVLLGCFKEDDCKDCQDAINHMYDKIAGQGCNPATMQNAVNGINTNCGATTGYIISDIWPKPVT